MSARSYSLPMMCALALTASCGNGSGPSPSTGAGATLLCPSTGITGSAAGVMNAYDTYGAQMFIAAAKGVLANEQAELAANGSANLGSSFEWLGSGNLPATADTATQFTGQLAAFWVWMYGGPTEIVFTDSQTYVGNDQDMTAAHTGFAITESQYDYFVTMDVLPAFAASGVGSADVDACIAPTMTGATGSAFAATIEDH